MVAGKVKAAMGFQRSPATPKTNTSDAPRRSNCSPSSHKSQHPPSSNSKVTVFSRSFGVYFPRSSVQIQPRSPPDVAELLRLVEQLQERESRLRTELLEHKILKETVAIVPLLEQDIASKSDEINRLKQSVEQLEADVHSLRCNAQTEAEKMLSKEQRIRELETEVEELKRATSESSRLSGAGDSDECSSSQRFQGLINAYAKSNLLSNQRKPSFRAISASVQEAIKPVEVEVDVPDRKCEDGEAERQLRSRCQREEVAIPRAPRVPRPPPTPTPAELCSSSSSSSSSETTAVMSTKAPSLAGIPPAPAGSRPPPPPPPPPTKGLRSASACVRRVPEVADLYHSLMRRDSRRESAVGAADAAGAAASSARDMIGEIENRSAHLLAIKSDVETQGDFIRFLIKEVNNAAFINVEDLVAFVKWLDDELSFLVDERAVLKHFNWPERKADAMREAAFGYCDLKKLEVEASTFIDHPRLPCSSALKKMQALLEKLEHGVLNLSQVREGAMKRYQSYQIPWGWMLDNGFVSQIKLASVKLAMKYMKRVSSELKSTQGGPEEEELIKQGVRFAFRVHQLAGGFDAETMKAFQDLRDKARSLPSKSTPSAYTSY